MKPIFFIMIMLLIMPFSYAAYTDFYDVAYTESGSDSRSLTYDMDRNTWYSSLGTPSLIYELSNVFVPKRIMFNSTSGNTFEIEYFSDSIYLYDNSENAIKRFSLAGSLLGNRSPYNNSVGNVGLDSFNGSLYMFNTNEELVRMDASMNYISLTQFENQGSSQAKMTFFSINGTTYLSSSDIDSFNSIFWHLNGSHAFNITSSSSITSSIQDTNGTELSYGKNANMLFRMDSSGQRLPDIPIINNYVPRAVAFNNNTNTFFTMMTSSSLFLFHEMTQRGDFMRYISNFTHDSDPRGMDFDGTNYWITGNTNDRVYRLDSNLMYDNFNFSTSAQTANPRGIAYHDGYLYLGTSATGTNSLFYRYLQNGSFVDNVNISNSSNGAFSLDHYQNEWYVVEPNNPAIMRYTDNFIFLSNTSVVTDFPFDIEHGIEQQFALATFSNSPDTALDNISIFQAFNSSAPDISSIFCNGAQECVFGISVDDTIQTLQANCSGTYQMTFALINDTASMVIFNSTVTDADGSFFFDSPDVTLSAADYRIIAQCSNIIGSDSQIATLLFSIEPETAPEPGAIDTFADNSGNILKLVLFIILLLLLGKTLIQRLKK